MKKAIFIPDIDNYHETHGEIWELCYPTIKGYANKIKADLIVLTERKFPEYHNSYEKHQVFEFANYYDWCLVMDADILLHKNLPDLTDKIQKHQIGIRDCYKANTMYKPNFNLLRDGRNIGVSSTFVMANKQCKNIWSPLEYTQEECNVNIIPWDDEIERGVTPDHFTAEYWLTNNLAKYRLNYSGILEENERWMFHHCYNAFTYESKVNELKKIKESWNA